MADSWECSRDSPKARVPPPPKKTRHPPLAVYNCNSSRPLSSIMIGSAMTDNSDLESDQRNWLLETLPHHERLAASAKSLLENMLQKKQIEYLSVSSRVKTLDGAIEKIRRKAYRDAQTQLTDLCGIRVITYLEEQVDQISKVIVELFDVDKKNSLDRSEILGDDKVGYRSTHFVCTIGKARSGLPENESLGNLGFEIQVRTVLQHAWAELAHDRSFKFGAALPTKIQRKLNLYSGMLEIVDDAFDSISREVEQYIATLNAQNIKQISNVELNALSLHKFLSDLKLPSPLTMINNEVFYPLILRELEQFGIHSIGDLERLINPNFLAEYLKHTSSYSKENYWIVRAAMLVTNFQKSLRAIAHPHVITTNIFHWLLEKYEKKALDDAIAKGAIAVTEPSIR